VSIVKRAGLQVLRGRAGRGTWPSTRTMPGVGHQRDGRSRPRLAAAVPWGWPRRRASARANHRLSSPGAMPAAAGLARQGGTPGPSSAAKRAGDLGRAPAIRRAHRRQKLRNALVEFSRTAEPPTHPSIDSWAAGGGRDWSGSVATTPPRGQAARPRARTTKRRQTEGGAPLHGFTSVLGQHDRTDRDPCHLLLIRITKPAG